MQLTIHHAPPKGTRPDRLVLRFPPSAGRGRPPADGPPPLFLRRGETVLAALPPGRSSTITFSGRAPKGAILVVSLACTLIRDPSEPITLTDLASGGEGPPLATAARIGRRPRQEVICIRPEVLFESLTVDGKPPPAIAAGRIGLLLADHVHRLAFWHPDFDPAYRRLPTLIAALRQKSRHLTALGVTAPVAGQVDRELRDRLQPHRNWAPPAPAEGATGSSPQLPPIEALRVEGADAKERLCAGLADRLRRVLESGRPAVVWSRWEPTSAPSLQPSTGPGPVQPIILTHEAAPTPRKPVRPLIAPDFRPRYTPPHAALSRPVEPFGPAGHAGGVVSAPTGGLWISSEARAPDLPPPPAWVIQTALSGGIDDWRDRTWPRPAGGAAALHLADLPAPACESDRTDRGTLTPACVDGPCPFGRPTLCDDGIGHREIEAAVPSPSSICREGVRVLKGLLTTSGAQAGTRQALFYLSVLGVIDHWDRPDPTGEAIRVHGFNPSVKPDRMVAGVETFFRETDITAATQPGRFASPGAAVREIERTWDRVGPAVAPLLEGETGSTRRTIEGILPPLAALAAHRRENLRMMRKQALTNLKAFLTGETCRHLTLRQRTGAVPPDWRCGVCDRCTEAGGKTSALSPQPSAIIRPQPPFAAIPFDPDAEETTARQLADDPEGAFVRAVTVLETDPRSLTARFLARRFASDPDRPYHARALLEIACRDADFSTVRNLVETSPPAVRSGAADLLDDAFGPCRGDDAAGWLFAEARRSWDDPDRADRLGCRAVASALADLDPAAILKTLDTLMEAP